MTTYATLIQIIHQVDEINDVFFSSAPSGLQSLSEYSACSAFLEDIE